jgi:hypothetical protein
LFHGGSGVSYGRPSNVAIHGLNGYVYENSPCLFLFV